MIIHKMNLDEFEKMEYQLVAIHTSLEEYRLAFYINQKLPINLSKFKNEIQIKSKDGETQFVRYVYEDAKNGLFWNLIQNKNEITIQNKGENEGLFAETQNSFATKVYLLPEFKKVDYFLKIENSEDTLEIPEITSLLNTIERVSTVYLIENENIKSKNNLIF
jgi:hypothetical protein